MSQRSLWKKVKCLTRNSRLQRIHNDGLRETVTGGSVCSVCYSYMTGRFQVERMSVIPIDLLFAVVFFGSCQLAGPRGSTSVIDPAQNDIIVDSRDQIGAPELIGRIPDQGVTEEDSIAPQESFQQASRADITTLEIATLLPNGGPPALSEFARLIEEGVEVAVAEMDKTLFNVRITAMDNEGDPGLTVRLVRELEDSKVKGVIGFLEDTSLEVGGRARRTGVPLVSPTARSASRAGPGVYSLEGPDPVAAAAIASYAHEYGYARIAILHSQAPASIAEADAFREVSEALGLPVVGRYAYEVGATCFGEEIIAAQDALRAAEIAALGLEEDDTLDVEMLEPVAFFLPIPSEDVEFVAPQIVHYGLDTLAIDILGTSGWTDPQVLERVNLRHTTGVVATTAVGRTEEGARQFQFRKAYEAHFQRSLVSAVPAIGHDAALVLLEGLKSGARSPEEIRLAIEALREVEGVTGIYSVVDGRILRQTEVVYIDDGILVPIG